MEISGQKADFQLSQTFQDLCGFVPAQQKVFWAPMQDLLTDSRLIAGHPSLDYPVKLTHQSNASSCFHHYNFLLR